MRILHVITSLQTGGAEKLMIDLLPRLQQAGNDMELCVFDGNDTPFMEAARALGIKIIPLGLTRNVYHPKYLFKLIRLIRNGKYDIVHTHNTAPQLFGAIASIFTRALFCTTEHNTSNRRRNIKGFSIIDRWMYSRYQRIICISKKAEENLRDYLKRHDKHICTINNGVDIRKYIEAQPSSSLEEIAPGSRKIIMVAGFRWEKDQDTLIRALVSLPDEFHLFLVGDGVRRHELEAIAQESSVANRVHFMGIRNDIPELLHAADYIVMSSHFEGLSLSSVEGMCAGKPFLASDVDGLREVVNGAGNLFPHENAEALAKTIAALEINETERQYIAERCKERASEFDIEKMASAYADVYNQLMKVHAD